MKRFIFLYIVFASLLTNSCSSDYTVLESVDSIILTADSSVKITGGVITFYVSNSDQEDLTSESSFFVNGNEIEGNSFTSNTTGDFEVTAVYYGVTTNTVIVNFHDGSEINFVKRVLIEDYTGTWCGYCPRVSHAIEEVMEITNAPVGGGEPLNTAVAVAIHRPTSNPSSLNYDPYNYDTSELEALLNSAGYPKGYLNRMSLWASPEPNNVSQAIELTQGTNPKLGLAMNATLENNAIDLDVNIKFGKDFSNIRLVVYILENGLVYDQVNYTSYYGGEHIIHDFEHNHVLRECITPLLGEEIDASETYLANTYTKSFSVPVPASVENADNIEFVAFVVDAEGNALNVRKAEPGINQDFEEL